MSRPPEQRSAAQRVPSQRVPSQRSGAQLPAAQRSEAQRSGAQRSGAQRSGAQRSEAQRPAAQRSAAQRSAQGPTAQRSAQGPTAQRSSVRRPPAQRRPERRPPRPVSPERYRRRRLAAGLIALLLLVGLGLTVRVALYDLGLADVEDVQVTGAATVPVGEVVAAAAVSPGGPLAAVDTAAIAARVAQLPGVESVGVGRSWPHTVLVELTERVPVAVAQTPEGPALIDRKGVVYRGPAVPDLPRLNFGAAGPEDPSTLAAIAVLAAVPDPVRPQVRSVDVTVAGPGVPGQVTLGLTDDRQVRWGAPERAQEKAAVLGPLLGEPGRVYDVTSPDLPTIRR